MLLLLGGLGVYYIAIMFWHRIIDWFRDVSERYKLVRDFNQTAKNAFISGQIPTLLEASISKGVSNYKHEFSKLMFSGFRIKATAGRPLAKDELIEIGRVVLDNPELSRRLFVLGWDTLEVQDINAARGVKWALKDFVKMGLMLNFGNNEFNK